MYIGGILRSRRKDRSWWRRVEPGDGILDDVRHDGVAGFSIHHAAVVGVAGEADSLEQSTLQQGSLATIVIEHPKIYRRVHDLVSVVVPGH